MNFDWSIFVCKVFALKAALSSWPGGELSVTSWAPWVLASTPLESIMTPSSSSKMLSSFWSSHYWTVPIRSFHLRMWIFAFRKELFFQNLRRVSYSAFVAQRWSGIWRKAANLCTAEMSTSVGSEFPASQIQPKVYGLWPKPGTLYFGCRRRKSAGGIFEP